MKKLRALKAKLARRISKLERGSLPVPDEADTTRPILVGPRPKLVDTKDAGNAANPDPWAQWQGPRLQPVVPRTPRP